MVAGERQRETQAYYASETNEAILVDRHQTKDYAIVVASRNMLHRWFGQGLLVEGLEWEVES